MKSDRRRHRRIAFDSTIAISRPGQPDGMAYTQDISRRGVRFQCLGLRIAAPGELQIQFYLGQDAFSLRGTVVRVRDLDTFAQEVAVAFADPGDAERTFLDRILEDLPT